MSLLPWLTLACTEPVPTTPATVPVDADADADTDTDADTDADADTDTDAPGFDPERAGPFTWTVSTQPVPGGPPAISARVYAPDDPTHAVVLLAGFSLSTNLYTSTAEHLASWGYLVVAPDLPGSPLFPRTHANLAGDVGRVLDAIAAGQSTWPSLDAGRIGVIGHSLGGKLGMLRAADDARIAVVVALDPVDAGPPFGGDPVSYPSVTPERMGDLPIPLALIGETTNSTGSTFSPACAPADENFDQYWQHAIGPALRVEVLGANHMSWLDDPDCGLSCSVCPAGTDDPAVTRQLSQGLAVAVFEHVLRGTPGAGDWSISMTEHIDAGRITLEARGGFGE